MDRYKDYFYYKGEERCPFNSNPYAGFWNIERYHYCFTENDSHESQLSELIDIFRTDFKELRFWGDDYKRKHQEIVALCLQSMMECGYYGEKVLKEINEYGRNI